MVAFDNTTLSLLIVPDAELHQGPDARQVDHAFERVVRACAEREETWIDDRIIESFVELHRAGHSTLEAGLQPHRD